MSDDRFPGETIVWGGTAGHPYTLTGNGGATFDLNHTADFAPDLPGADRSIKVVTAGTQQNTFVRVLNGPAVDLTNRCPRIWIKVDDNSRFLDGTLWLGSGGGLGSAYQWSLEPDDAVVPYYSSGEWVSMTLPFSAANVVGAPNRAALTDLNWQIFDKNTGPLTVWWGGFSTIPDTTVRYPNGVLSFAFDDGFESNYLEAAPYLEAKGWRGTAYIISDRIGSVPYMSIQQMTRLQDLYGWELGLHSDTAAAHNQVGGLTALSSAELLAEIEANRRFLVSNGIREPESFAYPQGLFNVQTGLDLAPLVSSARTTKGVHLETVPPGSRMKMYTRALNATDTAATINALIDKAVANREWLILTFHDIKAASPTGNDIDQATWRAIVDHAATTAVDVAPVGEVAPLFGRVDQLAAPTTARPVTPVPGEVSRPVVRIAASSVTPELVAEPGLVVRQIGRVTASATLKPLARVPGAAVRALSRVAMTSTVRRVHFGVRGIIQRLVATTTVRPLGTSTAAPLPRDITVLAATEPVSSWSGTEAASSWSGTEAASSWSGTEPGGRWSGTEPQL